MAGAAETQQALLDREIEKVQIHTVGRTEREIGMYRGRTGEGLVKLNGESGGLVPQPPVLQPN